MIKTHKPRGHQWTHASAFQQTEGFRDIDFEDCTAPTTKIYCLGEDADLSSAERRARKERIEQLADDFLNGTPLQILSARPCPEELRNAIGKEKIDVEESQLAIQGHRCGKDEIWEDVEDDWTILKRASRSTKSAGGERQNQAPLVTSDEHDDVEDRPKASCARAATSRAQEIAVRPSEEALKMAAALRQRRLEKIQTQTEIQNSPKADHEQAVRSAVEATSARQRHIPTANDWLSRRASHMERPDIEDQSLDELRLSRIETPSAHQRPSKQSTRSSARLAGNSGSRASGGNTSVIDGTIQETITPQIRHKCGEDIRRASVVTTAAEPTRQEHESDLAQDISVSRFGPDIATPQSTILQPVSTRKEHFGNSPRVYVANEDKQDGHTPFMFRKRGTRVNTGEQPLGARRGLRMQFAKGSTTARISRSALAMDVSTMSSPLRGTMASGHSSPLPHPARRASEPPTSLPNADVVAPFEKGKTSRSAMPETWPGTQALLCQAQQNLLDSPRKEPVVDDVRQRSDDTPTHTTTRKPRQQHSQEPMPSTQMMLAAFEGFSTVKKPRPAFKDSPLPTPTRATKGGRTPDATGSPTASSKDQWSTLASTRPQHRSSGLRHSIVPVGSSGHGTVPGSSDASTKAAPDLSAMELAKLQSTTAPRADLDRHNTASFTNLSLHTNPLATDDTGPPSPGVVSQPDAFVSFQAAQEFDVMLTESQLDRTIDDLTTDLLGLGEMEGIASQV